MKKILYGIGIVVCVLIVFQAGMFVGFRKAEFSFRGGDNYYRAFEGGNRNKGMMGGFFDRKPFSNAHGAMGEIISIQGNSIIIEGVDGIEKEILVMNDTVVKKLRDTIVLSEVSVGEIIVVVGAPNDNGQVVARLIRILPPPPDFIGQGTSTESVKKFTAKLATSTKSQNIK